MLDHEKNTYIKALVVDLSHVYGGASSRALGLMRYKSPLLQFGLAAVKNSPVARQAEVLGLTVHPVGESKIDPRILPNLVHIIRQNSYQLIDTQNIQSKVWGSMAATLTGSALVSTLNSWAEVEHGGSFKGRIYTALELATNRKLDRYIVVSDAIRTAICATGIDTNIVDLIYNAVEINPQNLDGNPGELRQKFDLPQDAIICTAIGRLVWAKGYEDLISALTLVTVQEPRLYCLIVGDGVLREKLALNIQQAGLQNRIKLVGFCEHDQALSILKASDIFVMPSRQEGTPVALLEAANLGKPIVASSCGGIPELVTHEEHALLTPPSDPLALAHALLRLCSHPEIAKRLADNALQMTQRKFSMQNQILSTSDSYQKALKHKLQMTI